MTSIPITEYKAMLALRKSFKAFEEAYVIAEEVARTGFLSDDERQELLDGIRAGHHASRIALQHLERRYELGKSRKGG